MNYGRIYYELMTHAKETNISPEEHYEKHHIVPRCLGGLDDTANLVQLTPEQHFIAHLLLTKMYPTNTSLTYAVNMMGCGFPGKRNRKIYGWIKRKYIDARKLDSVGAANNQYGTMWITNGESSTKVKLGSNIPGGWRKGRVVKALRRGRKQSLCSCGNVKSVQARMCKVCSSIIQSSRQIGVPNTKCKGKVFITNGHVDRMIENTDNIPDGWRRGRSTNHSRR